MDFGLLGPLLVRDGTRQVAVSAPRQRVLLAALLLDADRVVSVDALAETVWDGHPPVGARAALHSAIQRLRSTLGPTGGGLIGTRPPGYLIQLGDGEFDVRQFEVLAARGRAAARAGAWAQAADLLRDALALWRGEALADVPSQLLRPASCRAWKISGCTRWPAGSTLTCSWAGTGRWWPSCASWWRRSRWWSTSTPS